MNAKKGAPEPTPIASLDDFNNYLNDEKNPDPYYLLRLYPIAA